MYFSWCLELDFLFGRRESNSLFYCFDFDILIIAYLSFVG
nr:MAG TPA: hypothetical protein [Caudoviricetes sp.]